MAGLFRGLGRDAASVRPLRLGRLNKSRCSRSELPLQPPEEFASLGPSFANHKWYIWIELVLLLSPSALRRVAVWWL